MSTAVTEVKSGDITVSTSTLAQGVDLERLLWPIAHSAVILLLGGDLSRLSEYAVEDCGSLHLDMTHNRSLRLCSMQTRGNRAKVQGFREGQREGTGSREPGTGI